jgi:hypothetical protein
MVGGVDVAIGERRERGVTGDKWIPVGNGYVVSFTPGKTKHGEAYPARFLLLGPAKADGQLRPTVCAGALHADRGLVLDYGVISDGLALRVKTAAALVGV